MASAFPIHCRSSCACLSSANDHCPKATMKLNRRNLLRLACATTAARIAAPALAQQSSTRIVVGFPAGGPVDIAARFIAPLLAERLSARFEVENLPGDSGNAATGGVVTAQADGRTLLLCGPVNTINTTLFPRLPFRFESDLAPIASLYRVPLVVEVHPGVPVHSAAELLAYARSRPGELRVGYAGKGTPQHVGIELFKFMAGVDLSLVPYLGSAPALEDLVAGRIEVMFDPLPSSIGHISAGRLRALAVTGTKRIDRIASVPLMSDTVPGYEAGSWFGLCAPRSTSATTIDTLNAACNAALSQPATLRRLDDLGGSAMTTTPAEFAAFIRDETEKYARVIARSGIALASGSQPPHAR